jgi:hypothetical protein
MRAGLKLLSAVRAMDYRHMSCDRPFSIASAKSDQPLQVCAALLRNVRSFASDEDMLDCVAHDRGARYCVGVDLGASEMPPMPFPSHVLDQHTHPNIALLLMPLVGSGSTVATAGQNSNNNKKGGVIKKMKLGTKSSFSSSPATASGISRTLPFSKVSFWLSLRQQHANVILLFCWSSGAQSIISRSDGS